MNQHDRDNLNFLLYSNKEVLKDWHSQVTADDHEYARELLDAYSKELKLEAEMLKIECKMGFDYPDARRVIDRIRKL
jgi:hypothetical protein